MGEALTPNYLQKYLETLKSKARAHSEEAEREAHAKMQAEIEREEDREVKQFMQDTVEYYCQDDFMLLSYAYENLWRQSIKEQRELQEKGQPIELFIALESILARQGDYSGYTKTSGGRRYPLTIPGNYTGSETVRNVVDQNVPRARFLKSYYKFGVHTFGVGYAIRKIVDYLEERYRLDFRELERIHQRAGKGNPDSG